MNRFAGLALLVPYLRPYRGRVTLALLSLLVAAGTVLAFGACLRALIDRGFAQGRPDVLNYALASLLAVAFVLAVASGARYYLVSWLGERVVGTLRRDLFAHVVRLGPAWFEIKRSGDVMSRISSDAQLIEQVIGSSASVALRNTLMCVGGIVMLVVTNPKLALWVLAVVPVVVVPIVLFGRKVRLLSREAQARVADMVSEGGETLDAVRTVQAFAQEERAGVRFGHATEKAFDAAVARVSRRAVMTTLVIFIVFSAVGFLLWMGGQDVIAGSISASSMATVSSSSTSSSVKWRGARFCTTSTPMIRPERRTGLLVPVFPSQRTRVTEPKSRVRERREQWIVRRILRAHRRHELLQLLG